MHAAGPPILLPTLPAQGSPWRLVLLGSLARVADRATPMIDGFFVPYTGESRTRASLHRNASYDWNRGILLKASVAHVPFLRVGSLWTHGMPEAYPDHEQITLNLDISTDRTHVFRAHEKRPDGRYIIPPSYYKIPDAIADSRMALFSMVGQFKGVIIPCSEIFRFYFAGPSGMLGVTTLDGTVQTQPHRVVRADLSSWPDDDGNTPTSALGL